MPKRRFYALQSVLSKSNDFLLRWFLGVSAKVDGMPQFSELHDIRHALRMRQFYYYFLCCVLTVTVGLLTAPFLSTEARPALITYNLQEGPDSQDVGLEAAII
eukprot:TRINITY_DN505_c0_g1_i2.p1 TRINITY_DN505_c0_g1~~TRINITY_DN505_c0_g1_i2.p1  ORF type:complete len:103 (-),score=12.64 TRINITY_DN505_c0_g1_i2:54-362(-)